MAWLLFESVNIAWPRTSLAPPGAPGYQVWAAVIVLALIGLAGGAYLLIVKPQRKLAGRAAAREQTTSSREAPL